MTVRPDQARPVEERFWSHVLKTDGCWFWTAKINKYGYGEMRIGSHADETRRMITAHRLSYILHFGEPRDQVLHTCDEPRCVRPDHLYDGTHEDNMRDVRERQRSPKRQQTHCKRNHEFTPENTILGKNGTRHCRKCNNERQRKWSSVDEYPNRKLTTADVQDIKRALADGTRRDEIAARFSVSKSAIDHIAQGRTWAWVA